MNMKKMLLFSLLLALPFGQGDALSTKLLERHNKKLLVCGFGLLVASAGTEIGQRLILKRKITKLEQERKGLAVKGELTSAEQKRMQELTSMLQRLGKVNTVLSIAKFLGLGLGAIGFGGGVVGSVTKSGFFLEIKFKNSEYYKRAEDFFSNKVHYGMEKDVDTQQYYVKIYRVKKSKNDDSITVSRYQGNGCCAPSIVTVYGKIGNEDKVTLYSDKEYEKEIQGLPEFTLIENKHILRAEINL